MTVFNKILLARQSIGAIAKQDSRGLNYAFQSIEDVSARFKQVFDDINLLFFPSNTSIEMVGESWVLGYDMIFVDPDDDSQWVTHWGTTIPVNTSRRDGSSYPDDKAIGKAQSYAIKYFLLRTFLVTEKDDAANDIDSHQSAPAQPAQATVTPAPQMKNPHGFLHACATEWLTWFGFEGTKEELRNERIKFAKERGFNIESFNDLSDNDKQALGLQFKQAITLNAARARQEDGKLSPADEKKLVQWATNNRKGATFIEDLTANECDKILVQWGLKKAS